MAERVMATFAVKTTESGRLKFGEPRELVRISNFLKDLEFKKCACKTKASVIYDFKASKMSLNKVKNSKD